jgi:hypothetical protein
MITSPNSIGRGYRTWSKDLVAHFRIQSPKSSSVDFKFSMANHYSFPSIMEQYLLYASLVKSNQPRVSKRGKNDHRDDHRKLTTFV